MSDDDIDRIEAASVTGWLIMTGAATMVGMMPWSMVASFAPLFEGQRAPRDFQDAMLSPMLDAWLVPMLITGVAAGLGAGLLILAARAGHRLGTASVLGLGAVLGVAVSYIVAEEPGAALVFGGSCGLIGAGAVAFVRHKLLR